ncbi:MAG TPA: ATP-binding protein, partial [Gammaproteobacteria bacterium]|nr:ATP-binding protein [Gammaproteobacteria bacterium]
MLAWLMGAMRPTGPYPILILQGEQGTAKSTAAKVLRLLVDSSAVPLHTPPRKEEDLMIVAHN